MKPRELSARILLAGTLCSSALFLYACAAKMDPISPPSTAHNAPLDSTLLTSTKITAASEPDIASATIEPFWQNIPSLSAIAYPNRSFSSGSTPIPVSIKSVYSEGNIFFLVQYDDATEDLMNQALVFKGGNFRDPKAWTIDSSGYDDGFSFMFEVAPGFTGAKTFKTDGCTMACHTTRTEAWAPGMFPENDGRYDVWYWRSSKSNATGLADDDAAIGIPEYGIIKDDPNDEPTNTNIDNAPPYLPFKTLGGNNMGLDKRLFIATETSDMFGNMLNPITAMPWAANDRIPSTVIDVINPQTQSDFYDVKSRGFWMNGKWTVKFKRALTTESSATNIMKDVAFTPGNDILFSFAIHDHCAPGNHFGVNDKSFKLRLVQ
ncbi:MAG: ethylbenzene dehydrogenase-related protein [Candidatus Kapaibacterium sp.]|jgi:hypothetical protein